MPPTRRAFLKTIAPAAVPFIVPGIASGFPVNSKVRHAAVGCAGMGGHDLGKIASSPHCEIVALCDIDDHHLEGAARKHPKARRFNDYRVMFDRAQKEIDSCHVTIPDHMHAPVALTAIALKKHVYCQKPLTHELLEARVLRLAAEKAGVVTQMGTQIHSHSAYRTGVHLIRSGAIGKVRAVHTWADRAWSNNGRPTPATPPGHVHWDLWLGVAPERPWGPKAYHPKSWWSWIDFGTGNLGDMGCHLLDPVVSAIEIDAPTRVRAECRAPERETWPNAGQVHYEFPGTRFTTDPVTLTWYDGGYGKGYHPPHYLTGLKPDEKLPGQGSIFIGEKGTLLLPHWSTPRLLPSETYASFRFESLPSLDHWHSFIDACRGEGKTTANFTYAGPVTETVLLGNLAKRFPSQTLLWDAKSMRVKNFAPANEFTSREYRKGWEMAALADFKPAD